jgi:predicted SAM-dependent methyltransferase
MKLNLGCGGDFRPGWLNVDCRRFFSESAEFLCCDLMDLDGHIEDSSVSEMAAQDVLASIPWRELDPLFTVLAKKLEPHGVLFLRVPDAKQIARAFQDRTLTHHEAQRLIYGSQAYREDTHRSLWSAAEVQRRLEMVGLRVERLEHRDGMLLAWGRRTA